MNDARRFLPSVDKVLQQLQSLPDLASYAHDHLVTSVREVLDRLRIAPGEEIPSVDQVVQETCHLLGAEQRMGVRRVVNGTGIVLHTGLGRAVLPSEAMDALAQLDGCCSLQVDLETGERGRRDGVIEELLRKIVGCEAATVVNNNAAATLLVLAALCRDREVIVSRGQLIEIGGSFRLPDVIAESGARMVEVGTTNKTHLRDYANAITDQTAVLLHVNPSNYRILGFSQSVSVGDLATLKKDHQDLIVVDDLGCGALVDLAQYGLPHEATVQEGLEAGADVALSSGDKLIGGPQAGIIVGKKKYIDPIRKHPLARALRVGKFTIAALEATLKLFLNVETVFEKNPTLCMLILPEEFLQKRAVGLADRIRPYVSCEVTGTESKCGGGSLPLLSLKSAGVTLSKDGLTAEELARKLRLGEPSVVARVQEDKVLIDVRTLLEGDEERIEQALRT